MDLSLDNSISNISVKTSKKIEKNNSMDKNIKNIQKSKDSTKDSKNSYYSKFLEECNRVRLNNKNINPLRQSKIKDKKKKINSMEKIISYAERNNIKKKINSNLSKEKNDNKINNTNKKYINTISLTSNNEIQSKNDIKNKIVKNSFSKNITNKILDIPKIENLSKRENAYLILSYSNVLRLCERLIFSRSTFKLKEYITKKQIFETNKFFLKNKIIELENKIIICNEKLTKKFNATKIAEMTLNFITSNIENEFKLELFNTLNDDNQKKEYYSYIKLLYLLLDENYYNINDKELINELYKNINKKGYKNIKDYLYFIYIKNLKENKVMENIDKINELLNDIPEFLDFQNSLKYSKFISYNSYLIKEIINFYNDKIDTMKLKKECINLIEVINNKLKLLNDKNV